MQNSKSKYFLLHLCNGVMQVLRFNLVICIYYFTRFVFGERQRSHVYYNFTLFSVVVFT